MANKKKLNRQPIKATARRKQSRFSMHHGDARELSTKLPAGIIDVTITSPPYFDLKDYGVKNQIGYGQNYESYLKDLQSIFAEVYRATKRTGSLWIVIDTFRSKQEVWPLPFDLAAQLKLVGWILRDVIIWKKERTLPWTHKGTTRKIFEYVLVFSKNKRDFRYFPDEDREILDLKKWWVRYPERYSPKGKALEEIWSYDIPTQGSWGEKYVRHFCPLPAELVSRIINLTTKNGDIVFDPFAGTGTVPAQAHLLKRKYIGFELNKKYINMFHSYLARSLKKNSAECKNRNVPESLSVFEQKIIDLRIVKFARLLYRSAAKKAGAKTISHVLARRLRDPSTRQHKVCAAEFLVLASKKAVKKIRKHLTSTCSIPPLSKFGVQERLVVTCSSSKISRAYQRSPIYLYTSTNSHKYSKRVDLRDALKSDNPVLSTIGIKVEEPDG